MSGIQRRGAQNAVARAAASDRPTRSTPASTRPARSAAARPVFAALASLMFVTVAAVPHASSLESPDADSSTTQVSGVGVQEYRVAEAALMADSERSDYGVTEPPPPVPAAATAPAVGKPDPGTAQAIAYDLVKARGWSDAEFNCLVALWNKESHWNVYAHNPSSGAYGIPQALPGEKMATAGSDWRTNPRTQIVWGLGYIAGRYGTPCGAWQSSQTRGWY